MASNNDVDSQHCRIEVQLLISQLKLNVRHQLSSIVVWLLASDQGQ